MDSSPKKVCNEFYRQNDSRILAQTAQNSRIQTTDEVDILEFKLYNEEGKETESINYLSSPYIQIKLHIYKAADLPVFVIGVHTTDFVYIATQKSGLEIKNQLLTPGIYVFRCHLHNLPLLPGPYSFRFSIDRGKLTTNIYYGENLIRFSVISNQIKRTDSDAEGFFPIDTKWEKISNLL